MLFVLGSDGATDELQNEFHTRFQPFLKQNCLSCHDTETRKGDLDLERFASWTNSWNEPEIWKQILDQVSLGEMPPPDKKQPSGEARRDFLAGVDRFLNSAAESGAGDPGPVLLRRLNNAEYTYTLRDLTGIASLDPAEEFPGDSAAGEGFMNTGSSLVMSPDLFTKYLDAAKKLTEHALLLPDGFRFSEKTTRRDWAEEILGQIRTLYARYSAPEGGDKVDLQGIIFNTNEGGRLPLTKYLEATLTDRDRLKEGAFEEVARESNLSSKYLRTLWQALNRTENSLLLGNLRNRWTSANPSDASTLAGDIAQWQKALWKFSSVGHIGKAGGPKAWMEPVNPIVSNQELKLKLPKITNSTELAIYLVATDIGDGSENDIVIWERPRLTKKDRPELLAHDIPSTDKSIFGKLPDGTAIEETNLASKAPAVIEFRLPADVASEAEFITTASLHASARDGSVQLRITTEKPNLSATLAAGEVQTKKTGSQWTSQSRELVHASPILIHEAGPHRSKLESEFDAFRALFPAALCYTKVVPVDEVVTLTLAHREDHYLKRLMLGDREAAELDRLWDEYQYVSQNDLLLVDAFEQLWQYATQDADPKVFEPMRQPIAERASAFRKRLVETEPKHIDALVTFVAKVYRRPLTSDESNHLRQLYRKLRADELPHEDAFRHTLARIFVSPAFLYRLERSPESASTAPVNDFELATRLSYFLWSSTPDAELLALAAENRLHEDSVLLAQASRMLRDPRISRLSREFATAWLHVYDFESLDEKSETHFPEFASLRGAMQSEVEQFFTDLFQNDGSVLSIFDSDHSFLNESLAKHYDIPNITGPELRRVDGIKKYSRGGILTMAATLSKQSGASRTSPILRGNWISEVIVGEKLPKPPKGVPPLPEDAVAETLTMRELVQKHTTDPRCANCHSRIDGYGFAMEAYDAIGRLRTTDAGKPIDSNSKLHDGTAVAGLEDLRNYLLTSRRDVVVQQFCRKLLGYALGRATMLSDRPLIAEMQKSLAANNYKFSAAIHTLVKSRQFREIRGKNSQSSNNLVSFNTQEN